MTYNVGEFLLLVRHSFKSIAMVTFRPRQTSGTSAALRTSCAIRSGQALRPCDTLSADQCQQIP